MPDFTIHTYTRLLNALIEQDYRFQTFAEFLTTPEKRSIVLRHDVDARPQNSLRLALIEKGLGLNGVYNFRAVPQSWDEKIIRQISGMGHEIGYHYEELATHKGDKQKAFEEFKQNLEKLRQLAPVSTITMHGSPTSKHDSRDLWEEYNYRDLGIIGEPYFDIDFSNTLYLTDTGRRWDGHKVSIRDRVERSQTKKLEEKGYPIHSTNDIIRAANDKALPDKIMINIHPQRWETRPVVWLIELVLQNMKNLVKGQLQTKREKEYIHS